MTYKLRKFKNIIIIKGNWVRDFILKHYMNIKKKITYYFYDTIINILNKTNGIIE